MHAWAPSLGSLLSYVPGPGPSIVVWLFLYLFFVENGFNSKEFQKGPTGATSGGRGKLCRGLTASKLVKINKQNMQEKKNAFVF